MKDTKPAYAGFFIIRNKKNTLSEIMVSKALSVNKVILITE